MSSPIPASTNSNPSCEDDYDVESLDCDQALERIVARINAVSGTESLAIRHALGRVLAKPIVAPFPVPAHRNSAVDGYAMRLADLSDGKGRLCLVGKAMAGAPFHGDIGIGDTVRIMTGAVMPDSADTVVMQEHTKTDGNYIIVDAALKKGHNVRAAGEDIEAGVTVLDAGQRIGAAELGVIASLGFAEVKVWRQIRVAFVSTGDELRSLGQTLETGQIYDSNRYTLFAMLTQLGVTVIDGGVVADNRDSLRTALYEAAAMADVVITSGGVSVGEADYVREILAELGQVHFWKIAMKPGRPLAFGRIKDAYFFGLPGNPVAVMITYYQFVEPALHKLMGANAVKPLVIKARTTLPIKKRPGRVEYQRAFLDTDESGHPIVTHTGDQGSGILSSMSTANCLIKLPMDGGNVNSGDLVDVRPFYGMM